MSLKPAPYTVNGVWFANADLDRSQRTKIARDLYLREARMEGFTARQVAAITQISEREVRNAPQDE